MRKEFEDLKREAAASFMRREMISAMDRIGIPISDEIRDVAVDKAEKLGRRLVSE